MRTTAERLKLPVEDGRVPSVSAVVHRPSRARGAAMLLTHGAGGDLDDDGITALCEASAARGHLAVRANLPFREAGRRSPPPAERAVACYGQVLEAARAELGPRRAWAVGGKSYGGRVASLAVAGGMLADGLIFYGYPLHRSGNTGRLKVDHWPEVTVPCLFLQGDHDPFCDLAVLRSNLTKLPRRAILHVVEGGDHSLRIPASRSADGEVREAGVVAADLGDRLAEWLDAL